MFRKSLSPLYVKKFYPTTPPPRPAAAPSTKQANPTTQSHRTNQNTSRATFNTVKASDDPPAPPTPLSRLYDAFRERLRENRATWAKILIPELSKPQFNQDTHFRSKKPNSFLIPDNKQDRGKREESMFRFPVEMRLFLVACVLIYYLGRIIMAIWEDTTHGKLLQDIFKRLVRSRILLEQMERLQMLDEEGEENDLIPQGFTLLTRDEMIFLFRAMNWYAISHRTYTGFVEAGDTNPMVSTVLLNSRLHVWMLNLLAKPDTFSSKGLMDFEFVTECTNALLRFAHDETVSRNLVECKAVPILRLVRRELMRLREQEPEEKLFCTVPGDAEGETRVYSVDVAINSVEDLICEMVGFKWVHNSLAEEDMRLVIDDMCVSRSAAEKLAKSLNGSWWTCFSNKLSNKKHLFEQHPELQTYFVERLQSQGLTDIAQNTTHHSLPSTSLHELWKYCVMHRDTHPYTIAATGGFVATVALTWFTYSSLLKRKMAKTNYMDAYLGRHMAAYATFTTSVVAAHYVVLYPWLLRTIRNRVEEYNQDTQLIFQGSFLPLCVHNYKIFASYMGMLLLLTAAAMHATITLSILTGAGASMLLGLNVQQRFMVPDVDHSEFNRGIREELSRQLESIKSSPQRLLRGVVLVDEDERHHMPRKYANVLVRGARELLKSIRVQEVNKVVEKP